MKNGKAFPIPVKAKYSCDKCPAYCCSYPEIEVTPRDIERLARHFGLTYEQAEERLTKYDDPGRFDQQFESVVREVETNIIEVDAKLCENGRINHYKDARAFMESATVKQRLEKARVLGRLTKGEISLASDTLRRGRNLRETLQGRQLKEGSDFEYGYYPDEVPGTVSALHLVGDSDHLDSGGRVSRIDLGSLGREEDRTAGGSGGRGRCAGKSSRRAQGPETVAR